MTGEEAGDVPTNVQAKEGWQAVIEDAEATAEEFRERGWETLVLHPGEGGELRSADRGEIGWMRKKDKPTSPEILQLNGTES